MPAAEPASATFFARGAGGTGPPALGPVDAMTGLVKSVMMSQRHPGDPDVFIAVSDPADTNAYQLPHPVPADGSGAGLTHAAAWQSAVGESLERYALGNVDADELLVGTEKEMRRAGHRPVGSGRWALFDATQQLDEQFVQFCEDTPIAWRPAQSLTNRRDCLVPACMVHIPYVPVRSDTGERLVAPAISTGAACAATLTEGMLKGLCELIERDAFMIVWRNSLPVPRVRFAADTPLGRLFAEKFQRPGLDYAVFHTTLDLGMPSFVGVLIDSREDPPSTLVGGAAHPDPERAVIKTLLEMSQGLKWKDHMEAPPPVEPGFTGIRSFTDRAYLYALNDMRPAFDFLFHGGRDVDISGIASLDHGDPGSNLRRCVDTLAGRGLEALAMDLTTVDVEQCGLHVVRTMAPGLETMEGDHLLPFLGGRRWRDVPVELGYRQHALDAGSVNPYPHPYP
ncbi:MAG: YcaO-like family protein [Armatimonadetes bacterium]|nr:YcaO-like family protein [Armatimonadota bacterium]